MRFAEALAALQTHRADAMRLFRWRPDVTVRLQEPGEGKMTHPYLYVESRYGRVPWMPTIPEMFDPNWELV